MIKSKIPVHNKKSAASLIPMRSFKSTAIKNQFEAKSSVQTSLVPEVKIIQGSVTSLKFADKKPSRILTAHVQAVESGKLNKNLKTVVKQANKAQPEPVKLSNRSTKPVPVHQRKLSAVSVSTKLAKSCDVKKVQYQPEPLKSSNRTTEQVATSLHQRKLSSVNARNGKILQSQAPAFSQKGIKNEYQHTNKPLKEAQITSNDKHLKKENKPNLSKKDKNVIEKKASNHLRIQSSNARNLLSSKISNKENIHTKIVKEVKQIAEKQKNQLKKKEGSNEIQPISQKLKSNEDLKLCKSTESSLVQCVKENEFKLSSSDQTDNGVDDSEFKNSGFFKSLILAETKLTPGIIKLCSESKVSSNDLLAYSKPPEKKFLTNYATQEEFLEDLRRNSSNFQRRKGRSPIVPGMKSPAKKYLETFSSVNDFVEDLKRNSANFRRRETFQASSYVSIMGQRNLAGSVWPVGRQFNTPEKFKQSKVKSHLGEYSSVDELVEDIRRNSANFIKRRGKLHLSPFQIINSVSEHPINVMNSQPSALKGSETSKKKEKIKKKVTFYISPPNSESTSFSEKLGSDKIKTNVMKIPEQLGPNSTPEFEASVYRDKEAPVHPEDIKDKSNSSTPEFNFEALKGIPKDNEVEKTESEITPKFLIETMQCCNNSSDPICEKSVFSCSQPSVNPSNCKSTTKNVETMLHPNQNSMHSKNTVEQNISCSFYNKQYPSEGQTAIVRPMKQLSLSSRDYLNETGAFTVRTEENIFTPHPVSLYSNSYLVNSISPPVLADRSSILNTYAPIRTPLVLKSIAHKVELSPVRQRLNFEEAKLDRRESQICTENILTSQKMQDYLCDQECCILSSDELFPSIRNLVNPVAKILSNGDEMHFVPLAL